MNPAPPYSFHPKLMLRTPAYAYDARPSGDVLPLLLKDSYFAEAVYLASPVLYNEYLKLRTGEPVAEKEKQKIETALIKYYQRMSSRCTPFGLFSGCNLATWQEGDTHVVIDEENTARHTRLDMHYLCALSQKLAALPVIRERLTYYPNNSYYKTGDEIRYVEYKYMNGRRQHHISAVAASDYLENLMEKAIPGIGFTEMKILLMAEDVTEEEAVEFILELLDCQLLTSELDTAITGPEFIYQVLQKLEKINKPADEQITGIIDLLHRVDAAIQEADRQPGTEAAVYKKIMQMVEPLEVVFEENKLFQTDLIKKAKKAHVSSALQNELMEALELLNRLFAVKGNSQLEAFAKKFYDRYEDKEMPLLQILDSETGIGYPENSGRNPSPLTDELPLPGGVQTRSDLRWDSSQAWLLKKFNEALSENAYEVLLDTKDLGAADWTDLPPSLSIMFRLLDNDRVLLEGASGSSAAALLGRFAHADEEICKLVCDITEKEQEINPDVVLAEIIHLPEGRIGNILLHPVFRPYEIPYLAQSSVPVSHQVDLRDLFVSVRGQQIILRSKSLNKEIIPRLSSAHNFSFNALPVYQFLCDLQTQGLRGGLGFNWGSLSGYYFFLPRVRYKNIVLHEATWQLNKEQIELLIKELSEGKTDLIKKWHMPDTVVLADSDNELLVQLDVPLSVAAFIKTIKNRGQIVLKEFPGGAPGITGSRNGKLYMNQFVAPIIKNEAVYKVAPANTKATDATERSFAPGSTWLYFKIYCGVSASEKLLEQQLYPVIQQLKDAGHIIKWFYIRYNDPHFHLRLRFLLPDTENNGKALTGVSRVLGEALQDHRVWKLQTDTYQRELERYGFELTPDAETLFCIDSELKISFLSQTEGDAREDLRWLWGMKNIDWMLDGFELTRDEKESLLQATKESFTKEFGFGKPSLQAINKKYAANRKAIVQVMNTSVHSSETEAVEIPTDMFGVHEKALRETAARIREKRLGGLPDLQSLLQSYMHMCLNRLFLSEPRLQEAVLYDFLYKYYVSLKHQK
jgi:lantibiotic biosynthesis protein